MLLAMCRMAVLCKVTQLSLLIDTMLCQYNVKIQKMQ